MATLGNINAQGASGAQYQFALYAIGTKFKPLPAVYVFLNGNNPVYVGETADLSERFDYHHKAQEIRVNGADRIGVMIQHDGRRRLAIERDLLLNYRWPCNA